MARPQCDPPLVACVKGNKWTMHPSLKTNVIQYGYIFRQHVITNLPGKIDPNSSNFKEKKNPNRQIFIISSK